MYVHPRQSFRKFTLVSTLFALLLVTLPARQARADFIEDFLKGVLVVSTVGAIGIGANTAFTVHDASIAMDNERPTKGWAIAETVLTPPQALLFNGGVVWSMASGEAIKSPGFYFLLLPAAWTSQMATHGIWSLASNKVHPSDLYGVSWAIGANVAFTSGAVAAGVEKRLGGSTFGIIEMVCMTPTVVVGLSKLSSRDNDQGAWIALTGWSGALFLHGLASTFMGFKKADEEEADKKKKEHPNAAFRNPIRFAFAPSLVTDGVQSMPGLMMSGVF